MSTYISLTALLRRGRIANAFCCALRLILEAASLAYTCCWLAVHGSLHVNMSVGGVVQLCVE